MANIIGIALAISVGYWVVWRLRRLPAAIKNIFVIGGGFFLLTAQIAIVALIIGLMTRPEGLGEFLGACMFLAVLLIWNAFLALNIAQRLTLMAMYKGMREAQWQAAPKPYFEANPRVKWKEYQG